MKLTKKDIDRYRNELSELSERAGLYVSGQLLSFMDEFPEATVAEIRQEAKEIIENALGIYGDQAATMAADFFDEIMEAEGVTVASEIYDTIDREQMDSKVRYFARDLVEGNLTGFALKTSDVTRYYVKRQAYDNMVRNCYENDIRYARVPSGSETCGFCFMLCSRGFVYHTEGSAKGKSNHGMHRHCDCIIVPGVKGVTKIEGYDPEAMEGRWEQCRMTCGSNKRQDIIRECETRDPKWLYTGKQCSIYKEKGAKPLKKEKEVAQILSNSGFSVGFIKEKNTSHKKTADAYLNEGVWEFKIPEGYNEKTVKNQFKKAEGKGTSKLLISNTANNASSEAMISDIAEILNGKEFDFIDEVLFVGSDGEMRRMLRA